MTNVTTKQTGPAHMPWLDVESRAHDDARLSLSYLTLMALAGVLAAAAILTDSIILVIGAMIVAPDFGPAAGFSIGVVSRRWGRVGECLAALGLGYAIAALTGFVITTIATSLGHVPNAGLTQLALFVEEVSPVAFVVAVSAGLAGAISMVTAKSGAVIGVAVSITTVAAATNIGLTLALGEPADALASLQALLVNLTGLLGAGLVAFALVHYVPWFGRRVADRP